MDLAYPIGKHTRPSAWSAADRAGAIDSLESLPGEMRAAVKGLSDAQLDTPYRPGGWTVRQLVHHVADSHLNMYVRLKLTLTEDVPTIKPYEQDDWSTLADATTMPIEVSLRLLEAVHARVNVVLRSLAAADFSRRFVHPESGEQTIDSLLAMYQWHGRHHTAHVTRLREREGWT